MTKPLIDTARVTFSGVSTEAFEIPDIGDEVILTVKAKCTTHTEKDMANEGIRTTCTLKLLRVVQGVSEAVREDGDGQMSLADVDEDEGGSDDGDEPDTAFEGGPQFSGGE